MVESERMMSEVKPLRGMNRRETKNEREENREKRVRVDSSGKKQ